MGIVNVTPDSFSDGGRLRDYERCHCARLQLVEEGADILDIGGEITRPGAGRGARRGRAEARHSGHRRSSRAHDAR